MYRLGICLAGVLTAVVIGCGPGKELPDQVPTTAAKREPPSDPLGAVPGTSDPAAKAIIDRAVKAITQDKPERLEKVKVSSAAYKGGVLLDTNSHVLTDATQTWEVVWPDRVLAVYTFKDGSPDGRKQTFQFFRPRGWMFDRGIQSPISIIDMGQLLSTELYAQHGLRLGLTLTAPQAVFFGIQKSTEPPGTSVKIGMPNTAVIQATFDDRTGLPVRVEYHPIEAALRVSKVIVMAEHKLQGELMVPTSLELIQGGRLGEKWTLEKLEFPEKIDDTKFFPQRERVPGDK